MEWTSALLTGFGLAYTGIIVYLANQEELTHQPVAALRWLLYGVIVMLLLSSMTLLQAVIGFGDSELIGDVNPAAALAAFLFVIASVIVSVQVVQRSPRVLNLIRRLAGTGRYNPASSVHNAAFVLALAILSVTFATFVLAGGLTGLAQEVSASGISAAETLFTAVLQIVVSFLGIGLAIRRTPAQSLERLGLRWPTAQDISSGIGIGVLLFFLAIGFGTVWQLLVPVEQLQEQTQASEQVALSFSTLPLALLASMTAALGEEIFLRGALQPVFGLVTTSVFFTLLHTQYLITPGLFLIFVISLGFGWLRQRHSTSAAVIAHFVYNFIQLGLLVLQLSLTGSG